MFFFFTSGIIAFITPHDASHIRGKHTHSALKNPDIKESEAVALLRSRYKEFVDLPVEARSEELRPFMYFGLSSENWEEELEAVRNWAEVIKNNNPELYKRILDYYRK